MTASREMPRYQCHKIVWALKIKAVDPLPNPDPTGLSAASSYGATITPEEEGYAPFQVDAEYVNRHNPQAGGYLVAYDDSYVSFSPAAAFEAGYARIPANHRDRVRAEHAARVGESQRLNAFIMDNPVFLTLPEAEQARLHKQHELMGKLCDVLAERIASFPVEG